MIRLTADIRLHIERILSDRVYWLVNQADFAASDRNRRQDHIFASLVAMRNFLEGTASSPEDHLSIVANNQNKEAN